MKATNHVERPAKEKYIRGDHSYASDLSIFTLFLAHTFWLQIFFTIFLLEGLVQM